MLARYIVIVKATNTDESLFYRHLEKARETLSHNLFSVVTVE